MFTRRIGMFTAIAAAAASLVGACVPSPARGMGSKKWMAAAAEPIASDGDLLQYCGADGARWAAEFCKIANKLGYKDAAGKPVDEGWMIGWFANAIETGHAVKLDKIERKLRDVMDLATSPGNLVNNYAHGYANGIILGHSVATGQEPLFMRMKYDKGQRTIVLAREAPRAV